MKNSYKDLKLIKTSLSYAKNFKTFRLKKN